jgi:hypothetical protein
MSDGAHSLFPHQFEQMMKELRIIARAVGRFISEAVALEA